MNLSRYISFNDEVAISLSESDIDDILSIHSLPVSYESEHLNFDRALVKQFTLTLPKYEQPRALALLLDFSTVIDTDPSKCDFSVCLRQLVAIGYFMPQLLRRNQMKFLENLKIIIKRISNEFQTKRHFVHQFSASLSCVLSPLTKRMSDVDISDARYIIYQEIMELLLDLFKNEDFLPPKDMPRIIPFFFNSLLAFRSDDFNCSYTPVQNGILMDLLSLLNKVVDKSQNMGIRFSFVVRHIINIMKNKPLPIESRTSLLRLLISLAKIENTVADIIFNNDNSIYVVKFIANYLKVISFDFDKSFIKYAPQNAPKLDGRYEKITSKIGRTFEENIEVISDEKRVFQTSQKIVPIVPLSVSENTYFIQIITSLMQLSTVRSKTLRSDFQTQLMRVVINDIEISKLPILPYFLATWLYQFLGSNITPIAQSFHSEKFYSKLFFTSFTQYNDPELHDFILNIVILLTEKYHVSDPYFLSDLITFFIDRLKSYDVDPKILSCLSRCASKSPSTFVNACKVANASGLMANVLAHLFYKHSTEGNEFVANTRRSVIQFIDSLDSLPLIFQYFFENVDYAIAIFSHFYDESTIDFAGGQLILLFQQFTANSDTFLSVVNFLANFEMTDQLLLIVLNCCSRGFDANPIEIALLFDDTNLLDTLVNASVRLNCDFALQIFISIFSKMTQKTSYLFKFDIFLKIEGLTSDEFDTSLLWQIVFGDNQGIETPRAIKNSSPISLLFAISTKRNEIKKFLKFLTDCLKIDFSLIYEMANSELPSRLLKFISEYRTKSCDDLDFTYVLNFFLKLSLFSIKRNDLSSLFRLCTPLPDHKRPFFTSKIISLISKLFDSRNNAPVSFFELSGQKTYFQLPEIAIEDINKGITIYFDINFTSAQFKGTILEFISPTAELSIAWSFTCFIVSIKTETYHGTYQANFEAITNTFRPINFNFTSKSLEICAFQSKKTIKFENEVIFESRFNHFQALNNVPCQVSCFFISKRVMQVTDEVKMISLLPRNPITSYHRSEKHRFPQNFGPLFDKSIANDFIFLFYAAVSYRYFAVNLCDSSTMRITGKVCLTEPRPLMLLDSIGGIFSLMPFFAQIEQPSMNTTNSDAKMLPSLINLFSRIFELSQSQQLHFHNDKGTNVLAFLLSLVSLKSISDEDTVNAICKLYNTAKFIPLTISIIDLIFFNFKLWIYLPINTQINIYQKFFQLYENSLNSKISNTYLKGFSISKLLMLIRIYLWDRNTNRNICLGNDIKLDPTSNEIDGKRPEDCSRLRSFFWDIIKNMSEKYMRDDDMELLVSFCCDTLDLEFAEESLTLFTYLLDKKNEKAERIMSQGKGGVFSVFFNMFKVPDSRILKKVLMIYLNIDANYLKPFSVSDWDNGILREIDTKSIDIEFLQILQKNMVEPRDKYAARDTANLMIANPRFIPLYLLAIQNQTEENLMKYFNLVDDLMKMDEDLLRVNWDHPFLLLLMTQIPNDSTKLSELAQNCLELVAFLYNKSLRGQNPKSQFFKLRSFIHLVSKQTMKDYSHVLRLIFTEFLAKENLEDRPYTLIEPKTFIKIYVQISEFILITPIYTDEKDTHTNFTYQELFKLTQRRLATDNSYVYKYSARTVKNEWKDKPLALLLMEEMLSRAQAIYAIKDKNIGPKVKDTLHPFELMGLLIQTGLSYNIYNKEFLEFIDRLFSVFSSYEHLKSHYRHALLHVYVGLINAAKDEIKIGKTHLCADMLLRFCKIYAEFAQKEIKISLPQINSVDEMDFELFNPIVEANNPSENKLEKIIKGEIASNEVQTLQLSNSIEFTAQLVTPLKSGEMSREVLLRNNLEQYAHLRQNENTTSMKQYRKLFRTLSSENGPWQPPEFDNTIHRRLYTRIFGFCRFFMKPNYNYTDHKDASLLRDLRNSAEAQDAFQKEFAKSKLLEFKGDLALVATDKQNLRNANTITENVILKCDARYVTMKDVNSGKIAVTQSALFFDSNESFVQIKVNTITKIFLRRYLLLNSAIEIFTNTKKSYFFDFPSPEQRKLILDELSERQIANIKYIQMTDDDILPLLNKVTHDWQVGKISNFEYILKLNKYSGRTYNDLSQYPVFPWVIADYTSNELDLTKPETFRDLSKPMGAINKERISQLRERAEAAGSDEMANYLYGAFYSSAAVVIGYLIRMEPFTTLHIHLQNNKFDHGDRLFESIPRAWESASSASMDFRELTPEFFYFPDFLVNENNLDLGKFNKTGEKVNDVHLPKWASSPTDFICKNREALETPFVTLSLHHWVNLIFGPNSRMPNSRSVDNVFHPYYYESSVVGKSGKELDMIREIAACFGAAPRQLFTDSPPYRDFSPISFQNAFFGEEKTVNLEGSESIISISPDMGDNVALNSNLDFYIGSKMKGHLNLKIPSELEDIAKKDQLAAVCSHSAVVSLPWDHALYIFDIDGTVDVVPAVISRVHNKKITSLSISQDYIASGSEDCTINIWDNHRKEVVHYISKHQAKISVLEINQSLRICASASADGYICITSLISGESLCGIYTQLRDPSMITVSNFGYIVAVQNGKSNCRTVVLDQNLKCICYKKFMACWMCAKIISWNDGCEYIAVAMNDKKIKFFKLPFLTQISSCIETNYNVTALAFHRGQMRLVVGDDSGRVHCHRFIQ